MLCAMQKFGALMRDKVAEGPAAAPAWLLVSMYIVMMLFVYTQISITYTHGSLVATLAMVEDTSAPSLTDSPPPYSDDANTKLLPPSEVPLPSKPLTSSNRRTIMHLRQTAGRGARFRGLGVALLYGLSTHWISNGIFYLTGKGKAGAVLGFLVSQIVLYRLNMLWTHIVISAPSSKRFYQRILPRKIAKKAILPTFIWAAAQIVVSWCMIGLIEAMQAEGFGTTKKQNCHAVIKGVVTALIGVLLMVFVFLPANVALTRFQASLLSEEDQGIVRFDRTFGGRADEGFQRLGDAWKSFEWEGRKRLITVYVKTLFYQMAATGIFAAASIVLVAAWTVADGKMRGPGLV